MVELRLTFNPHEMPGVLTVKIWNALEFCLTNVSAVMYTVKAFQK